MRIAIAHLGRLKQSAGWEKSPGLWSAIWGRGHFRPWKQSGGGYAYASSSAR